MRKELQENMEALALEGVLLQKALNEGRKLLREKVDLEAQVKSLSDILAEKDHQIMDLEAAKESLTRSWQDELRMNGKIRKELSEYKKICAEQRADILCKDGTIAQLLNPHEKHTV